MRRNRITLMVAALTALVAALVLAGGAAARANPTDTWALTLQLSPTAIMPNDLLTSSGYLTKNGKAGGTKDKAIDIVVFTDSQCSTDPVGGADATTDEDGFYTYTGLFDFPAGVYYLQSFYIDKEVVKAASECVPLGVGVVAPTVVPTSSGPDRYGYCSVAGNTDANGNPLGVGTFLNLLQGQPATDDHYTGATPAFWVEGVGVTCDLTPAQAAIASASTVQVNHVGAKTPEEGPLFYTFVPQP